MKRVLTILVLSVFLFDEITVMVAWSFSGSGSGTEASPYIIATATQLQEMNLDLSAHYLLGNDIDASDTSTWNDGTGFLPIAPDVDPARRHQGDKFTGTFDGQGHAITGLFINRPSADYVGLFGYIRGSTVQNLAMKRGNITGQNNLGGLVGYNYGSTVSNCSVTGDVVGGAGDDIGGLIGGYAGGTVENCSATGTVSGTDSVGGLLGRNGSLYTTGGRVENCSTMGVVSGVDQVGGLIGYNRHTVENCYSACAVSASDEVGGLTGYNNWRVSSCYATGTVSGGDRVGGLVGYNLHGTVENCSSTGVVSGVDRVGGLIGYNYGWVSSCYASGTVSGGDRVGGLVGYNFRAVSSSYATGTVSGFGDEIGGLVGMNDDALVLSCYATGAVTDGYQFVGGLVGLNDEAKVESSYATGAVSGHAQVGGLIGYNTPDSNVSHFSTVSNCFATGDVAGSGGEVGGLIGRNFGYIGRVSNCYATGAVSGNLWIGGLVGFLFGEYATESLSACYWDINTSATVTGAGNLDPDPSGVTGKTTIEMFQQATFEDWDFAMVWWIAEGNDYPRFYWESGSPPMLTVTPTATRTPVITETPLPTFVNETMFGFARNWNPGVTAEEWEVDDLLRFLETSSTRETITINIPGLPAGAREMILVRIPAGTYRMGSPDTERGRYRDREGPVHPVTLTNDFYVGETEVTQAQWQALMNENPSNRSTIYNYGIGNDYPVYYVSWNEINQTNGFLDQLDAQTSYSGFRLPTEAEWEYACRAGTSTRFSFGDNLSCDDECGACPSTNQYMWWCGNNTPSGSKPVRGKAPNAFGLYDMHGNVWEWCEDWFQRVFYSQPGATALNPLCTNSTSRYRVFRGGDWSNDAGFCRSAVRNGFQPSSNSLLTGVRVVLPVSP